MWRLGRSTATTGPVPADHRVRQDHNESLLPLGPELSGHDPEQFVEQPESWPAAFSLQNHQLLAKSQIFEQEIATATEETAKRINKLRIIAVNIRVSYREMPVEDNAVCC